MDDGSVSDGTGGHRNVFNFYDEVHLRNINGFTAGNSCGCGCDQQEETCGCQQCQEEEEPEEPDVTEEPEDPNTGAPNETDETETTTEPEEPDEDDGGEE